MPDWTGEIEARIRLLADQLMGVSFEISGIVAMLPPSAREASAEDLDEDHSCDLRADLLCLLRDHIRPAAIGLRQAAGQRAVEAATTTFDAFAKIWSSEAPQRPRMTEGSEENRADLR